MHSTNLNIIKQKLNQITDNQKSTPEELNEKVTQIKNCLNLLINHIEQTGSPQNMLNMIEKQKKHRDIVSSR
jgi:hypothetical protein